MKILLTGATGYIGKRLLPVLVGQEHQVLCLVRDARRFNPQPSLMSKVEVLEADLLKPSTLCCLPADIDAAYYLVHSMASSDEYQELEYQSAVNFREAMLRTKVKQVIYLSGIANQEELSKHLTSRRTVETELGFGNYHLTTLRAGIIIGSGSASFEIIRDLVEKLPIMFGPHWLNTRCQPISITDVLSILTGVLDNEKTYEESFDIGGPEVFTYREMLYEFARVRGLKRHIYVSPFMTANISKYWLYFITSVSYKLAKALVESMSVEVVCRDDRISELVKFEHIPYRVALGRALDRIEHNEIVSSWKDAFASGNLKFNISDFIQVPRFGCLTDRRLRLISDRKTTVERIWRIGGVNGWYVANKLWRMRGYIDRLVGGVGLRRGRTNADRIAAGDAIDFWRVLYANKEEGRLLLFAEMKLPGEAWLEFRILDDYLIQTATFRPLGVWGRLYWTLLLPFHGLVFRGLINYLSSQPGKKREKKWGVLAD